MNLADATLISAITEPTDRSIPPEITTVAWAIAANASGIVPMISEPRSNEVNAGATATSIQSRIIISR
jgi:hypothetical protein